MAVKSGSATIHNLAALHAMAKPLLDVFERQAPEFGGSPSSSDQA